MPVCPLCLHDNPPGAAACEHCGRHRFSQQDHSGADAQTVQGTKWKDALPRFGEPNAADAETHQAPVQAPLSAMPTPEMQPRLLVVRGQKLNAEFPLYDGANHLGRSADRPADIDLSGLEPADQVWSSRTHAVIHKDKEQLSIEDLNSLNGTFLNRQRLHPGKKFLLKVGDVIQIGTVQLRVLV